MPKTGPRRLIVVLGDQLSTDLSSLQAGDRERDVVLMCEVAEEATYVDHHKQKLVFVFSAMRHFADELRQEGWEVDYVGLTDSGNTGSFAGEVKRAAHRYEPDQIIVTEPGEWRVLKDVEGWEKSTGRPVKTLQDRRFLCSRAEFAEWSDGRREMRMEHFYRVMRRRTGLLMDGDHPEGGRWNFDEENRKPADRSLFMPEPPRFRPDATTREVMAMIEHLFGDNFGDLQGFGWAVTRKEAERARDHFIDNVLPGFGDNQDAMLLGEDFLYHSLLSPYLNTGLLNPLDLCRRAEERWREEKAPLNAVEGFIRQIIGWREYVRGIYWLMMPDYAASNHLDAKRDLPWFYWSGETDMACIAEVVSQTRRNAYAHHIQRLMITGNFALLAGVEPRQVHEWYLAVYADAFEWVELPNTIGMSQFADGGILGSKPYASSGAYIDRMSDYCGKCRYDVKKRVEEEACPFNALYWDFIARNESKLGNNRRLAFAYRNWARMDPATKKALRTRARSFLNQLS
ncbi:cryptochrome/photolyase family protein [Chelativorans sp. ZYF759]|uniref:cryptochrome/photolyase family protein n=1 Tax=Chelativorans sp. ZYF759 TaxID=2692213 RepID=UPI00145F3CC2|nr:cryptochrome/photolyase family protein [Chelativorans sp. ZYF759]NMG38240.1 cryptochrome/photolyase family protein [Chelativorans sp. ZYF759]